MEQSNQEYKDMFLYPRTRYYGQAKPENLIFNSQLQEFAQRVSYITNLQTNGKLSCVEAFDKINMLWQQLKHSKKELETLKKSEHNG